MSVVSFPTPKSSTVASVSYDDFSQLLVIKFQNGGEYNYFSVPESEFIAMREAVSVGRYINENIKGKFLFERI